MIMLSSNDYLGLTHHPRVIEAGKGAMDNWGSSSTGARLANGLAATKGMKRSWRLSWRRGLPCQCSWLCLLYVCNLRFC